MHVHCNHLSLNGNLISKLSTHRQKGLQSKHFLVPKSHRPGDSHKSATRPTLIEHPLCVRCLWEDGHLNTGPPRSPSHTFIYPVDIDRCLPPTGSQAGLGRHNQTQFLPSSSSRASREEEINSARAKGCHMIKLARDAKGATASPAKKGDIGKDSQGAAA